MLVHAAPADASIHWPQPFGQQSDVLLDKRPVVWVVATPVAHCVGELVDEDNKVRVPSV